MSTSPLPLAWLALALAACGPAEPEAPTPSAETSEPVLDEDGLGRLGAETPFDTAAVRAALPSGFAVEGGATDVSGAPILWALRDGLLILEVHRGEDGRVGRVDAVSDQVEGPDGARTGQSYADLGGRMACDPGEGDLAGRAVCRRGAIRYVFAHGGAPDAVDDDELEAALLERMVWMAD